MELAQPCQLGRGLVCRPFTRSALNLKASKVRRQLHESYRSTAVQVAARSTSVKVRRAAQKDFAQVGKLITESFWYDLPALAALEREQPFRALRARAQANMAAATEQRLQDFWQRKDKAAQDARALRAEQEVQRLRAELSKATGGPGRLLQQTSQAIRSVTAKSSRHRMFMCLVAEAPCGIIGTVTLTSAAPEALLPAPFPTSRPQRMYLSSLAVAHTHRRQGIASLLLNACELLGKRWQQDTLWLHVDWSNAAAQQLYTGAQYSAVGQDPFWLGPFRRQLLRKTLLQPLSSACQSDDGSATVHVSGSKRLSDGGFVWDRQE